MNKIIDFLTKHSTVIMVCLSLIVLIRLCGVSNTVEREIKSINIRVDSINTVIDSISESIKVSNSEVKAFGDDIPLITYFAIRMYAKNPNCDLIKVNEEYKLNK